MLALGTEATNGLGLCCRKGAFTVVFKVVTHSPKANSRWLTDLILYS